MAGLPRLPYVKRRGEWPRRPLACVKTAFQIYETFHLQCVDYAVLSNIFELLSGGGMRVLVLLALVISGAFSGLAQEPEWLFKVPKYFRLKGGSSVFVVDKMRKAILFDGGAYETYVTYDGGETWKTIFDMKMFFIDVATRWQIDEAGNWYYNGRVYGKQPINLVTDDAGETIRYLVADTNALPFTGR